MKEETTNTQAAVNSNELLGAVYEARGGYPYLPFQEGKITIIAQVDPKRWRFRADDGREGVAHLDWLTRFWKRVTA